MAAFKPFMILSILFYARNYEGGGASTKERILDNSNLWKTEFRPQIYVFPKFKIFWNCIYPHFWPNKDYRLNERDIYLKTGDSEDTWIYFTPSNLTRMRNAHISLKNCFMFQILLRQNKQKLLKDCLKYNTLLMRKKTWLMRKSLRGLILIHSPHRPLGWWTYPILLLCISINTTNWRWLVHYYCSLCQR